jgi:hypothetical protein
MRNHPAYEKTGRRSIGKRRRRYSAGKVLFYAGVKHDGTPRSWTLIDVVITIFCFLIVVSAMLLVIDWLLGTPFTFANSLP